jgi:hypothetical protein
VPPRSRLLALAPLLVAGAHPARAERRELHLGIAPAYAITYVDQRSPSGGGGDARIQYSITDAVGIQAVGGMTAHPLAPDEEMKLKAGLMLTWYANVGVVYALDVVRVMPFFELSLGALGVIHSEEGSTKPPTQSIGAAAMLGLGADYLVSRRFSVGVALRYHASLSDLEKIPLYLTVGPRLQLRFGP